MMAFESAALVEISRLTNFLKDRAGDLIIDADVHVTDTKRFPPRAVEHYYHGRPVSGEDIVREMDSAGISLSNIWQNPAATPDTGSEDENAEALLTANAYVAECASRFQGRFIPSGWTDPKACGVSNAIRIAEICVRRFGFALVKMNPAQNRFPMDSQAVVAVADRIVELGAAPTFHFGADSEFTPISALRTLAKRYDPHPIVAVHMGGGGASYLGAEQMYHEARELGLKHSNIRYIFSAIRDTYIEEALITYQIAGAPYSSNLFCGSDAPYGRMAWNFGGFRAMFRSLCDNTRHSDPRVRSRPGLFCEDAVQRYMGGNFATFVLETYRHILDANGREA